MSIARKSYKNFSVFGLREWARNGPVHGFLGNALNFAASGYTKSSAVFAEEFGVSGIYLPEQVHSKKIIDLRTEASFRSVILESTPLCFQKGDGVLIPRSLKGEIGKVAFGIRTADCLPIIMWNDDVIALVHAGWRGLAGGIIEETLNCLATAKSTLHVAIGPATCAKCYEVGKEVIDAIGEKAVYEKLSRSKFLLSLRETAENIIKKHRVSLKTEITHLDVCTIEDCNFHSYRREGKGVGSNLAFVVVAS